MACLAAIVVTTTLFKDDCLFAFRLSDNLSSDRNLAGISNCIAFTSEQNVAQDKGITRFTSELFNCDFISGGDPILLAACAHYCEHGAILSINLLCPNHIGQGRVPDTANRQCLGKMVAVK